MPEALKYDTSSTLDWLTVTTTTRNGRYALQSIFERYKTSEGHPTRFYGFDCLRDEAGLTWGTRSNDGRGILIAPGETATKVFGRLKPVPVKVTRIDLATDVWLEQPRDQVKQSSRVPLSRGYDGRVKATFITGTGGRARGRKGNTLYLGSRQSNQYGRFYDKGLQQKTAPPGKWLRYEVEYKGQGALDIAKAARELLPAQFGEWVMCTVYDWWLDRAVVPIFRPGTDTPGTRVRSQYKQTTPEKKLAWLSSQVRPTVKYLFEQGMRNETLAALGLELAHYDEPGYSITSSSLGGEQPAAAAANGG